MKIKFIKKMRISWIKLAILLGVAWPGVSVMAGSFSYQDHLNQIQNLLNQDIKSLSHAQKVQINRLLGDNLNNDAVILMQLTKEPLFKNSQGWSSCQEASEVLKNILMRSRTFQGLQVSLEYSLMMQMAGCPRTGVGSAVEPIVEHLPTYLSRVNDALPSVLNKTKEELSRNTFKQELAQSIIKSLLMDSHVLCLNQEQAQRRSRGESFAGSLEKSYQACANQQSLSPG